MALNLVIDIGNSRTKFGLFEERELLHGVAFKNQDLQKNNHLFSEFEIDAVVVSSVNSKVEELLNLEEQKVKPLFLRHVTPLPIDLNYDTPETLGKDRIAAVVGAYSLFPHKNLLVIDAGTCVTYDFLTEENKYLGGAISPGVQMRLRSMNDFTNKLPLIKDNIGLLTALEISFFLFFFFFQKNKSVGSVIGCFKISTPLGISFIRLSSTFG